LGVDEKTPQTFGSSSFDIVNIATNKPVVQKTESTETMGKRGRTGNAAEIDASQTCSRVYIGSKSK